MDPSERPLPLWKQLALKLKLAITSSGNTSEKRIWRRRKFVSVIARRLTLIKISLFVMGYLWMLAILSPFMGRGAYIDENALQPGQVNIDWNWGDVHVADAYLAQLERLNERNITAYERASWLSQKFKEIGISASTQNYSFTTNTKVINGTNAYAVLSAPRHSGTEAMIVCASWVSRIGEHDGAINIRGVATVLALANFVKKYSHWGKDIIFVISDGYLHGMQAWLAGYHAAPQSDLYMEPLELTSGVIWTALNIDYPGHSFSHFGLFFEGLNGRLPNQDLMNSFVRIALYSVGVPVVLYDHVEDISVEPFSWIGKKVYDVFDIREYIRQARNVVRHLRYQVTGRGSGVHGIFHQFRIDGFTLFAVPAMGPHGFHSIGRTVESTLRTMNNLLERLHASFFFYIMTAPDRFLKIGLYLPSVLLISVAMLFHGLSTWVDAGWVQIVTEKEHPALQWRNRSRPVVPALCLMISTHFTGALLYRLISSVAFLGYEVVLLMAFIPLTFLPLLISQLASTSASKDTSISMVLKSFNLCIASTVISITTLLNFSLAVALSVLLGIPLVMSSSSKFTPIRLIRYVAYAFLSLGWLLIGRKQLVEMLWSWQALSVWFAPFVCVVYFPLVLQAGIVCLIPT